MHPLLRLPDWLPFLQVGPAGRIVEPMASGSVEEHKGTSSMVRIGHFLQDIMSL